MGGRELRTCRRLGVGLLLSLLLPFGCAGGGPLLAPAERPELAHIRVEAGDIANRPYLLLGVVEWPAPGHRESRRRCTPDRLRARALEIYGDRVDGIVHFASWKDARQSVCSGTAVHFVDGR